MSIERQIENKLPFYEHTETGYVPSTREKIEGYLDDIKKEVVLERFGVIKLFEELRDTGFVKWNNRPITEQVVVDKNIFGRPRYETKIISDYTPAIIKRENKGEISLFFNESDSPMCIWSEIKIRVEDNLSLVMVEEREEEGEGITLVSEEKTKINQDNLGEIIANKIKECNDHTKRVQEDWNRTAKKMGW